MKTKTCYFCSSILNRGDCQSCKDKYNLEYVYTSYFDRENNGDIKLNCSGIGLNINGINYYVVLRFWEYFTKAPMNETKIYGGGKYILTLPGYPFTPANIRDKLKTYLVFS